MNWKVKLKNFFNKYCSNLVFAFLLTLVFYVLEVLIFKNQPTFLSLRQFFGVAILISLFPKRVRQVLIASLFIFFLNQALNYSYYGNYVQPMNFYQILINFSEVTETFFDNFSLYVFPFLTILVALVLFLFFTNKYLNISSTKYAVFLLMFFVIWDLVDSYRTMHHESGKLWHKHSIEVMPVKEKTALQNYYRAARYFTLGIVPNKLFNHDYNFPKSSSLKLIDETLDRNIVLIIGETLRAKQMSLFGYTKYNTTPLLAQYTNLYLRKVYSAGTMTKSSVTALINSLMYPEFSSMDNNLFKLAKRNHFHTHFISAQMKEHQIVLENLIGKAFIDDYKVREDFHDSVSAYDFALVQVLDDIDFTKNNFIVLQQRGSHSPYHKQSPKEFKKFPLEYDNSVLYTDYVLDTLIKSIRAKSKKPVHIFFTSDHGELLHENGLNGHGWFDPPVYEVPFIYSATSNSLHIHDELRKIRNHFDISMLIAKLLGYAVSVKDNRDKEIYINGSDINGLAGYLYIKMKQDSIVKKEERHNL